ncbi:hypothetical protein [Phenylobacterium sp.]|jgi:hypothetical protein|uniref:hypothetical protein n=1 Tax=Phenylobacterium sp. TaxID=1871053 RepID=UPI002F405610
MNSFSPSDAALEGFRLTRERPGTVLAWGGVYFAGIMVMAIIMIVGIGPKFITFLKEQRLQSGDTEAFGSLLAQSWPAFLVVLAAAVFLLAVLTAGIYRLVLRPSEKGFSHLKLGRDELRLALVHLLLFAIGMAFLFAIDIIVAMGQRAGGGPVTLVLGVVGLVAAVLMIWVGVRLSLATPMAFAEQRFSLAAAWRMTRGRFWSLFGMIVLAVIFYVMIWILVSIIGYLFVTLAGGAEAIMNPASLSPARLLAFVANFILQLVLPILQVVMIYAPLAVAYQRIAPVQPERVAEAFGS